MRTTCMEAHWRVQGFDFKINSWKRYQAENDEEQSLLHVVHLIC